MEFCRILVKSKCACTCSGEYIPHIPKAGNRDCTLEIATFSAVCKSDASRLVTSHGVVVSSCRNKTDIARDEVKSSLTVVSGDNVMCCPIPKRVEKFPKGSTGIVDSGRRLREWGKSVSSLLLLLLSLREVDNEGPSHRANVSGTDTFPPLSTKDTVHVTDSDRIMRTVLVSSHVCFEVVVLVAEGRRNELCIEEEEDDRVARVGKLASPRNELCSCSCSPPLRDSRSNGFDFDFDVDPVPSSSVAIKPGKVARFRCMYRGL
jgi:hypothetical protein